MSPTLDEIRALLAKIDAGGAAAGVGDRQSLLAAGVIDSVAMVDLIHELESTFGIHLDDADLTPENFDSVVAIRDLVDRKRV